IEIRTDGVTLTRPIYGGVCERMLSIEDLERPVVATYDGTGGVPHGDRDAEVVVLTAPATPPTIQELPYEAAETRPGASVRLVVLVAGRAVPDALRARMTALGARVVVDGTPWDAPPGAAVVAVSNDPGHAVFEQARLGALAVGPEREDAALAIAAGLGARAVRVWDPALEGADYDAFARTIAATCRLLQYDLVLCGERSAEEGLGVIGPATAEHLGIPH